MRDAKVLKGGERADGRRYQIISNEQKRADDRNHFRAVPDGCIHTAAVRVEPADDHIVDPNKRGQHAHCRDQTERAVAGDRES